MLVSDLLKSSLRKIGALSSGETIEPARQTEALSALQSMLRSWGALSQNVFASVTESVTLEVDTEVYTWGSDGDISTLRPNHVTGAYILDNSGVSHPMRLISGTRYRTIPIKTISARPYSLYFDPLYPLANVYLYPVPNAAETLYLTSFKSFIETGSFGLSTDTLIFPGYYEEPMIYNLAIRLAPEYGKIASAEIALIARESLNTLNILNLSNQIESIGINIPVNSFGHYSINTDSYR